MQTGIIFDIKRYAIHDGPGIRTTVFLKGCSLSCLWCHNPEGLAATPQVIYRAERCIGCGECVAVCPEDALTLTPDGIVTNYDLCEMHGICTDICPSEAREMAGIKVSSEYVLDIIKKDIPFYNESQGGVTFSGGEPLIQPEFLLELLKTCGREHIHRTVDTSGHIETEILMRVAEETDLFLFDLKLMDATKHRKYTGTSNQLILTNLKKLSYTGADITVRIPLIPGINDDDENIDLIGMFLRILPEIKNVHILPYHDFQKGKYARFNTDYLAGDIPTPSKDELSAVKNRLEDFELIMDIGG